VVQKGVYFWGRPTKGGGVEN